MIPTACAGQLHAIDTEQLEQLARPWDIRMRQVSPGRLSARLHYLQINGILLYREFWSHRIFANGATPKGYFFFGAPVSSKLDVGWCGTRLGAECLAFARSHSETDFVTPAQETHICMLVPDGLLRHYLGEESAAAVLPDDRFAHCDRRCGVLLLQTMQRVLDKYVTEPELLAHPQVCEAIEWQLMGGLVEFLLTRTDQGGCLAPGSRYRPLLQAVQVCERARAPMTVRELADAAGVSVRILEKSFREGLQMTPGQFLRCNRMNRVRRALLSNCKANSTVTGVLAGHQVSELGRFAVDYKRFFGESPSATLTGPRPASPQRFADLLGL
jgi:AraC-like DNA-binding protein